MAIPDYQTLMTPFLGVLADGKRHTTRDLKYEGHALINPTAAFLASSDSSFIVGTEIIADGGVLNL